MVDDGRRTDDGRTPDHGHPISSPYEPDGSGELKIPKNCWVGYMLKVAFLLASSIHVLKHKLGPIWYNSSTSFIC